MPASARPWTEPLAAVDLGSNSFRLEIGQIDQGLYRRVDYLKETVRLGAGLDADGMLGEESMQRGLACLTRFAQRLRGFAPQRMRAVAVDLVWHFAPAANALLLLRAGLAAVEQQRTGDASDYRVLSPHFGLGLLVPLTSSAALELGWDITEGQAFQPVSTRASAFSLGLRLGF